MLRTLWPQFTILKAVLPAITFLALGVACSSSQKGSKPTDDTSHDARHDAISDAATAHDLLDAGLEVAPYDALPPPFSHQVLTFNQAAGAAGVSTGQYGTFSVEYPPIQVDAELNHVLTFAVTPMMPPWRKSDATPGPVVLYSDDMQVWVISPMDQFFLSLIVPEPGLLRLGVNGEVDSLPSPFPHRFLLVKGHGIQATLQLWGDLMRQDRGKERVDRYADTGLGYLGYWTDNGAYYYYKTEPGMNEADTMLALKAEADSLGIPYGYLQLDSWWYFKAKGEGFGPGGLLTWEPQPQMFPDGLVSFQQALGIPLILHNRWFSPDSPYLQKYPFVVDGDKAFPEDGQVYQEFASNAASWGAVTYEQDWLVLQYLGIKGLRTDPELGRNWMKWMDEACLEQNLTMQLCMTGSAHLMASLDMKTPTSVRTSIDYAAGISKESFWPQFHVVNMVAWGLGIWPFKDNFHSSEKHGEAEALVSALSAGMVGLGDGLGKAVKEIALRTCRQDGLLLKPDRPAFPIDAMFLPHTRPFITYTFSDTGAGRIIYLAAYNLARKHPERTPADDLFANIQYDMRDLGESMVWPELVTDWHVDFVTEVPLSGHYVLYDWRTGKVQEVEGNFDMGELAHLYDFHYFVLAPILGNNKAFLGEPGKYVTAADKRFASVTPTESGFEVVVTGAPGEVVDVLVYDAATQKLADIETVTVRPEGTVTVTLD